MFSVGDVVELALEEHLDAVLVSLEVEVCFFVVGADHLGEVDGEELEVFVDHEVELVEVAVDEAVLVERIVPLRTFRGGPWPGGRRLRGL